MSGTEEAKVNQCDIRCPVTAMGAVEYRSETEGVKAPSKIIPYLRAAGLGLKQAYRAGVACEAKDMSEEEWQPSKDCLTRAQETATKLGSLATGSLNDHERKVLGFAEIKIIEIDEPE